MEHGVSGAGTSQVSHHHRFVDRLADEFVLRLRVDGIDQQIDKVSQAPHHPVVILLLSPENRPQEQQMLHDNGAFRQCSKYTKHILEPGQHFILMDKPCSGIASYMT